jgi:hypothetical protein
MRVNPEGRVRTSVSSENVRREEGEQNLTDPQQRGGVTDGEHVSANGPASHSRTLEHALTKRRASAISFFPERSSQRRNGKSGSGRSHCFCNRM